jgi:hypothetical protein
MNQVTSNPIQMVVEINTTQPTQVTVERPQAVVTAVAEQGPPGPPGASGTASTYVIAGDGLDGGGLLNANVTLSVDSTVARVGGVLWLDYANARVGINQLDPKIDLQIGDAGLGSYSANLTNGTPNQIVDQWSALDFRSAKYQIQLHAPSVDQFEISELFIMHNGGEAYLTEYAIINQGVRLAQYSASIFNNTVRLLCSPTYGTNSVKVFRTVIAT